MKVDVLCREGCRRVPLRIVRETALRALRFSGRARGEACILLTRDREIRFRGKDSPTDVLSFPVPPAPGPGEYLGDVAISLESASRNARRAGWRLAEEVQFLVIHGILHLLGHDHESDQGEMNRLQARIARGILGRDIPEIRVGAYPGPTPGRRRKSRVSR
jgi:probable rRNA maturation factor